MKVSRRKFLGSASAVGVLPLGLRNAQGGAKVRFGGREHFDCVIVGDGAQCGLSESHSGYEAACLATNLSFSKCSPNSFPPSLVIVLPAFTSYTIGLQEILAALRAGALVVLESGAGFADAGEFADHSRVLCDYFGIGVSAPVNLWTAGSRGDHFGYVEFNWPVKAAIRDFTAVVPVAATGGEIIGRVGELNVALRMRIGNGTLVFLGSPLGPSLHAGDREALAWFCALVASARTAEQIRGDSRSLIG